MNQTFKFYSDLYSEGLFRGVCSHIIQNLIYLISKNIEKIDFFLNCWSDKSRCVDKMEQEF